MKFNEIARPEGRPARKTKRFGRGDGSGHGGTSGRGHKGQKARAGGFHKRGFEGGQMPLQRRLPKRGFTNIFAKVYTIVNLDTLEKMEGLKEVTLETLTAQGVVRKERSGLKILGRGNITRPLVVKAHACSAEAKRKIEASGGQVEVIGG